MQTYISGNCGFGFIVASLVAAACAAGPAVADTFTEALTGGKVKADVRLRYEQVDQDNALDSADGLTLRTRLGYNTGSFRGFDAYVEMENSSGPGGGLQQRPRRQRQGRLFRDRRSGRHRGQPGLPGL
ncbi:hypothetical protein [Thiohalobacter thiocyanaticus]|uniref:hypothetical protein n=1 Tax=Thiohalobacter thiocyanaticus TaxID=585455 RepID=UPI001319BFE2|nr:hypothetical protein [Thiohalobacter thiocyanaticus]